MEGVSRMFVESPSYMLWREPRTWKMVSHMSDELYATTLAALLKCELSAQQLLLLHALGDLHLYLPLRIADPPPHLRLSGFELPLDRALALAPLTLLRGGEDGLMRRAAVVPPCLDFVTADEAVGVGIDLLHRLCAVAGSHDLKPSDPSVSAAMDSSNKNSKDTANIKPDAGSGWLP